jgi:hypothetical protein
MLPSKFLLQAAH